jgi:hypothetical protein
MMNGGWEKMSGRQGEAGMKNKFIVSRHIPPPRIHHSLFLFPFIIHRFPSRSSFRIHHSSFIVFLFIHHSSFIIPHLRVCHGFA